MDGAFVGGTIADGGFDDGATDGEPTIDGAIVDGAIPDGWDTDDGAIDEGANSDGGEENNNNLLIRWLPDTYFTKQFDKQTTCCCIGCFICFGATEQYKYQPVTTVISAQTSAKSILEKPIMLIELWNKIFLRQQ